MSSRFASGLSAIISLLLGYDSAVICGVLLLAWNFIGFILLRASLLSGQAGSACLLNRELNGAPYLFRDRMSVGQRRNGIFSSARSEQSSHERFLNCGRSKSAGGKLELA
jgi:hypothetical protein